MLRKLVALLGHRTVTDPRQPLLEATARKIDTPTLSPHELRQWIDSFPEADRPIVTGVLSRSAILAHPSTLAEGLDGLLQDAGPPRQQWVSLEPAGWAKVMSYHARKLLGKKSGIAYHEDLERPERAILAESIASRRLLPDEIAFLAQIPDLTVSGLASIELAPNYLDFVVNNGDRARGKMLSLVERVKSLRVESPDDPLSTHVDEALLGLSIENLSAINEARSLRGLATAVESGLPAPGEDLPFELLALHFQGFKPIDAQGVENALLSQGEDPDHDLMLRFLASEHGFHFDGPRGMAAAVSRLSQRVNTAIEAEGRSPSDAYFVTESWGEDARSESLINLLFAQITGTPQERFISSERAAELAREGQLGEANTLVVLNDINGSGNAAQRWVRELEEPLAHAGGLLLGHLVEHPDALVNIASNLGPMPKVRFVADREVSPSLTSDDHPFVHALTPDERERWKASIRDESPTFNFGESVGDHAFFLSRPDNAIKPIHLLLEQVLQIRFRWILD